ncbi:ABC transporter permease [Candidatus Methylacidiphilum fumarolicum]|uniref:ABC-type dipeptide/oligopeptide/nickel transport system, permease component n=2 Tax=Candidatus Methylacidiphilum fumarolicum TaxID=591154 RepID=I0JYD3_METFB|nr:ABC transporter permease [Candidatus Methylacidiphilum fumarolicum]MBW6414795.1 ABC transporter permease [Candidatus Methylacidiphilum fumarolicum]TFE67364.1 ABC transporter substrate-binding protein [Candidatus Methylacidiphilum fumarolicum]TFE73344.1 ABC transporter permease [Candidatus Methylacidiphilum fumarolicum]TFE74125.1 ABC transporter permease [Candidatus Methylacidiphilum fumarolicum]TFE77027.1 ABC transporter substrate-binding protein [Candidatus Methylacidiphilum fumarolicum]
MILFIVRRLLALIPLLLGVTFMVFFLMSLTQTNYLTPLKAERDISPQMIEALEKKFGLDKPWYERYFLWLNNVLHGDFGYSWIYKMSVIELLMQRVQATLLLNLSSLLLAWCIAIPIGVLSAIYKDSLLDRLSSFLAYISISFPEFFLALLAVYFAARTGWFPIGGLTSIEYPFLSPIDKLVDIAYHLVLPTLVLGIGGVANMMRIMRGSFLDAIRADYVLTARAKGLPENAVMFRHVLRNAINPLISTFGYVIAGLLSGSLLVENIMNYPGIGQLIYSALMKQDQFVVLGSVVFSCLLLVLGNLIADILLAWVDPRIVHHE